MLSPQEFEKLKARLGGTSLPSVSAPVVPAQPQVDTMNPIKQYATDTVGRAVKSVSDAGKEIDANTEKYGMNVNTMFDTGAKPITAKNVALGTLHNVGALSKGIVGAIFSPATQAVASTMKGLQPFIDKNAGNSQIAQDFATNPVFNATADLTSKISEGIKAWSAQNPEKAALGMDAAHLAEFLSLGLLKSPNVSDVHPIDATVQSAKIIGGDIKTGAESVKSAVGAVKTRVLDTIDDFGSRIARPDVTDATAVSLNPKKALAGTGQDVQVSVAGRVKKLSDLTPDEYSKMQMSTDKSLKVFTKEAELYKNNRNPLNDPTEIVGQRVDKALGFANKKRQAIGAKMGEIELKYADKPLDIGEKPYGEFTKTIKSFDNPKYGVDGADADIVRKLVADFDQLQKDGATIGDRLDFVRSWDKYLNDSKDAFGKFKENATVNTRIQSAVASLKEETVGAIAQQDKVYRGLRTDYRTYKKIDEIGDSLLGKDGMLGDRIKGGATVKRAIMSNSDAGARQFLIKLKELTGYDALKDADLALTAMKNVGDYQGLSLLQILNDGKTGLIKKALEKVQDAVVGNNQSRIRGYIQDTTQSTIPNQTIPTSIPNGGQITNSINQSNIPIQPDFTTFSPEVQRILNMRQ